MNSKPAVSFFCSPLSGHLSNVHCCGRVFGAACWHRWELALHKRLLHSILFLRESPFFHLIVISAFAIDISTSCTCPICSRSFGLALCTCKLVNVTSKISTLIMSGTSALAKIAASLIVSFNPTYLSRSATLIVWLDRDPGNVFIKLPSWRQHHIFLRMENPALVWKMDEIFFLGIIPSQWETIAIYLPARSILIFCSMDLQEMFVWDLSAAAIQQNVSLRVFFQTWRRQCTLLFDSFCFC